MDQKHTLSEVVTNLFIQLNDFSQMIKNLQGDIEQLDYCLKNIIAENSNLARKNDILLRQNLLLLKQNLMLLEQNMENHKL